MSSHLRTFSLGLLGIVVVLGAGIAAAEAKCSRLAFSVNDYGKEGPTKDAKNLLDKHIATWTAARGIKKFTTGKKDVTCELFLDFGVFDEHTCKASATVCWADSPGIAVKPTGDLPAAEAKAVGPKKAASKAVAPSKKSVTPAKAAPSTDGEAVKAKPSAPKAAPTDAPAAPAPAKTKAKPV